MAAGRTPTQVYFHHGYFLLTTFVFLFTASIGVSANNTTGKPVLLMLTRPEEPFTFTQEDGSKKGFVPDLMKKLSDILQVDIQIELEPDAPQATQVTQMMDRLTKGTADVIGPLQITFVNERVVDFTKPILNFGIVPVMQQTDSVDDRYNIPWLPLPAEVFVILKPFCAGVWLISILCFIGVSLFLYLINRFNPRERRHENEVAGGYDDDFGLAGSFLFAFSCLVWQGYPRAPRSISGRILTAFWWIFVVIFLMSYTAKLVFYLNRFPVAISGSSDSTGAGGPDDSLKALVDNGGYTFGVVKNSPEYYFFRQSRIPVYEEIWTRMNDSPGDSFVNTLEEGWERTRQGNFVFLVNSLAADYAIKRKPCDLVKAGPLLTSQGMGLAVQPNSPNVEKLSEGILEARESGVIIKLYNKWWSESATCGSKSESGPRGRTRSVSSAQPLELAEFGGAFILLIIGAIIAAIALLLEIVFTRRQNKKKETEEQKPEEAAMVIDTPAETAKV